LHAWKITPAPDSFRPREILAKISRHVHFARQNASDIGSQADADWNIEIPTQRESAASISRASKPTEKQSFRGQ
jgi:hypothetical protein